MATTASNELEGFAAGVLYVARLALSAEADGELVPKALDRLGESIEAVRGCSPSRGADLAKTICDRSTMLRELVDHLPHPASHAEDVRGCAADAERLAVTIEALGGELPTVERLRLDLLVRISDLRDRVAGERAPR
jgi:hypothetical protein